MRKHWQGSNFPKIPKILASMGSAGAMLRFWEFWGNLILPVFSHFRLQKFWGNLIPVDVFASDVAKMLPGSNFPKVSETRNA